MGQQLPTEQARVSRGWRNVIALGGVSFLTDFSTEMIYPLLPGFLTTVLRAPAAALGAIEGAAESVSSFLKLASGWLADRFRNHKLLMLAGYSLSTVAKPLVALASAPWHVLAVRLSDRTGKGIRTAPRDVLLAGSVSAQLRGRAFGFHRAMDHAGAVCGPLAASGLLVLLSVDVRCVFALAAVPGLLCVLWIVFGVRDVSGRATPASELPEAVQGPEAGGLPRGFAAYLVVLFLFTLGNSSDAFLLLRIQDLGVAPVLVPAAWVALHVVKMLTSVPGGLLSDRIGRRATIVAGWGVYAATYAGFALASAAWQAWALFCVYGLYFGLTEGVERAFVADMVSEARRGRAYGAFHFAVGLGALPASLLMGVLWDCVSPAAAFLAGACLALVAAALLCLVVRPPQQPQAGPPAEASGS